MLNQHDDWNIITDYDENREVGAQNHDTQTVVVSKQQGWSICSQNTKKTIELGKKSTLSPFISLFFLEIFFSFFFLLTLDHFFWLVWYMKKRIDHLEVSTHLQQICLNQICWSWHHRFLILLWKTEQLNVAAELQRSHPATISGQDATHSLLTWPIQPMTGIFFSRPFVLQQFPLSSLCSYSLLPSTSKNIFHRIYPMQPIGVELCVLTSQSCRIPPRIQKPRTHDLFFILRFSSCHEAVT